MACKIENLPSIVNFHDEEIHRVCFASFEQMRHKGKLCDVTLISEGKRFAAHKLVLAATVPFFNGMFLSNMSECNKDEISMLGLDACALEAFIGFAYTGSVQVTPCNVQSLLIGASFLHIGSIRNICCKYIEERLSPSTVLTVRDFARSLMCAKLANACDYYIFDHFEAVAQTEAFLNIEAKELLQWLDSDELYVSSEERLFEIVMNWIEHTNQPNSTQDKFYPISLLDLGKAPEECLPHLDAGSQEAEAPRCLPQSPSVTDIQLSLHSTPIHNVPGISHSRLALLPELLKRIRLPLVSASYISSVISKHHLVRKNIQCRDLLDEVRDMLILRDWRAASSFCCRPRRGQDIFGVIYAVGGLTANGDCHGIVETYHPSLGRWELTESMPSQRSRIGVVSLNGRLYAIGGFDGTARLNTTEVYDPKTKAWQTLAPMIHKRSALGAAVMDGLIYVCGGYDGVSSLRACEVYDPRHDKWFVIPSMNEPRSAGGLVALDNGCLYTVGGHNGLAIFSSVECYNHHASSPVRHTTGEYQPQNHVQTMASRPFPWYFVARMLHRRCRHGVAALRNRIIVAGGYNGVSFLSSVEMFDPAIGPDADGLMGQWTEITPLGVPRSRVGLAVTGGRLYAIGGYDGVAHLRTVECLQPDPNFQTDSPTHSLSRSSNTDTAHPSRPHSSSLNQSITVPAFANRPESAVSVSSDEDIEETSSVSTASTSEGASRSAESQTISQLECRTVIKRGNSHRTRQQPTPCGAFANWTWTPAAPLIAHEGWVGVGVLPINETEAETKSRPLR